MGIRDTSKSVAGSPTVTWKSASFLFIYRFIILILKEIAISFSLYLEFPQVNLYVRVDALSGQRKYQCIFV